MSCRLNILVFTLLWKSCRVPGELIVMTMPLSLRPNSNFILGLNLWHYFNGYWSCIFIRNNNNNKKFFQNFYIKDILGYDTFCHVLCNFSVLKINYCSIYDKHGDRKWILIASSKETDQKLSGARQSYKHEIIFTFLTNDLKYTKEQLRFIKVIQSHFQLEWACRHN